MEQKTRGQGTSLEIASRMEQLVSTCKSYRLELRKQDRSHTEEVARLTQEIEALQLESCRMQHRLDHWKSTCQRQQNESLVLAKSKLVEKENEALKEDIEVLKTVVQRLNHELSFYQSQLRQEYQSSPKEMPHFSFTDSKDSVKPDDLTGASKTILPLLLAYDETINHRNGIIQKHETLMQEFKSKFLTITEENERLHQQISEFNAKGTVSNEEWKTLYDNAVLVLQENDLLHEKIDVLNKKITAIESTREQKVEKLKKKITCLEEEKASLKLGLTEMQNTSASLTAQIAKLGLAIKERIPRDQHEASVKECKREFELLRSKYADERNLLTAKLNAAAAANDTLKTEINNANSSVEKLQQSVKEIEKSNLGYAESMGVLKKELSISVKALQLNESSVKEMMKVAESIQQEKDALQRSLNDQRQSTAKIMAVRNQEVVLMKDFEGKVKVIEDEYERKLQQNISRANKLEEYLEIIAERHQADLSHLHDLLQEKTIHIEKLNNEKGQLIEDLETVWGATTKDQRNLNLYKTLPNRNSEQTEKKSQTLSAGHRRDSGDNKL